jgi:antitoxin ParD1/3/4
MNINLTPQLEQYVQQKVATGRYNNASEVLREALRLMEERDQERETKLAALRQAIQQSIDSGPAEPWEGAEEIKRQARAEWEAEQSLRKG